MDVKALLTAAAVLAGAACVPAPQTGGDAASPVSAAVAASGPSVPVRRVPRVSRTYVRPAVSAAAPSPGAVKPPPLYRAQRAGPPWNWDAVAQCESGGHWHHHSSLNGYWGGLQMTLSGWRSYHGDRYAPRPDLASKAQQIAVAEHWLRAQGWGAWPSCGRYR